MTKNDMARIVVQALFNLPQRPAADHWHVRREARSFKSDLEIRFALASQIVARNAKRRAEQVAP